jgi:DNA-binding CsgD family transcriptional regulator
MTPWLRAVAAEALDVTGETDVVAGLHASWYSRVARQASQQYDDAREAEAWETLARSEADLYAALMLETDRGEATAALRLAADLGPLAYRIGDGPRLTAQIELLLASWEAVTPAGVRADALLWASMLGADSIAAPDTIQLIRRRWRAGMELARAEREPTRILRGLAGAVLTLPVTLDLASAMAAAEEGRALAEEIGHVRWLARFTAWSGMVAHQRRDFEGAARFAADALAIALRASDRRALILVGLLVTAMPADRAPHLPLLPSLEQLYEMAVDLHARDAQSWILAQLASRASERREYRIAAEWIRRRLDLVCGSAAWHQVGYSLLTAVPVVAGLGEPRLAARTHGTIMAMLPTLQGGIGARDSALYERVVDRLRTRLGQDAFDEEVRAGSLSTWPDAVTVVLSVLSPDDRPVGQGPLAGDGQAAPPGLTARERDVLTLVAQGLSNKDIAADLGVAPKTVMHHSMAIYRKLGVRGRAEAAVAAVRLGLAPR